jgi:hypothetical protein
MSIYTERTPEELLKHTLFVVEATSFEQHTLWEQHSKQSTHQRYKMIPYWEQINPGHMIRVGGSKKRPYNITVNWYRIEGQLVMFWEGCSLICHYGKAREWIEKHFKGKWDGGHRLATTDAMNFGHCVQAIIEANQK